VPIVRLFYSIADNGEKGFGSGKGEKRRRWRTAFLAQIPWQE